MDDIIAIFIEEYFAEDLQHEIRRSFSLCEFFEYKEAYVGFLDIIMAESVTGGDGMRDQFTMLVQRKLDYVLSQHQIQMVPEASIYEKNEICEALGRIQNLIDYTGIIRSLETLESNEVQLAMALEDLTMFDVTKIMTLIESFNPRILQTLKDFIYAKEAHEPQPAPDKRAIEFSRFFARVFGENSLGTQMVQSNVLLGEKFEAYLDLIEDDIIGATDDQTALNILSVIFLSSDGCNSPILVWRKNSYRLLHDLDKVSKVEIHLLNHVAKLTEYQKAEEEKTRQSNQHVVVDLTGT